MSSIKNRKKDYSAISNQEEQDEEPELTEEEIRLLKREARKIKWVRRLRKCNDLLHAICKSVFCCLRQLQFGSHCLSLSSTKQIFSGKSGRTRKLIASS